MVRITTWNVNGIRNPFGYQPWRESRSFSTMFDILEADIVIMQELKIQKKDLRDDMVLVPGWDCYFSLPQHKKGYSGVGIYTRQSACAPVKAEEGLLGILTPSGSSTSYRDLPEEESIGGYLTPTQVADLGIDPVYLDSEGRCLVLEFPAFVLFGVYSPANSNGQRDDFRFGFLTALETRIRNLVKKGKRVILTGDLNITRELIDSARTDEHMRQEGITKDDFFNSPNRRIFNQLVAHSTVIGARDEGREEPVLWDICREFHPNRAGMFTHWEQKINARPGNFGSRIDFILCSIDMREWFSDSDIQEGLMGSDHCPVYATTKHIVECCSEQVHMADIMNPPGMFKEGKREREYSATKDPLPMSGKLLPEFDKRRSIKDMFKRGSTISSTKAVAVSSLETQPTLSPSTAINAGTEASETLEYTYPPTTKTKKPPNYPEKRHLSSYSSSRPFKRNKSTAGCSNALGTEKGQKSLKGFFVPKPATDSAALPMRVTSPSPSQDPLCASYTTEVAIDSAVPAKDTPLSASKDVSSNFESFIDPEASRDGWSKLFTKKSPPRCEHEEPCIKLTTKKAGVNCGRQFWICPRPIGPSGQKESGSQWRCGTFIWASDWNSSGKGE